MKIRTLKLLPLASALIAAGMSTTAAADAATDAQIQQLKAQIEQLQKQQDALANRQDQIAAQPAASASPLANLNLWGYGEIYYTHPVHQDDNTRADLARAVFGIGSRFDEHTRFNSEFEVEHAVSSSEDSGEFEVEQFYVQHDITDRLGLDAGLFLIPAGLINLSHEPTNFYGVQRNFVETLIIPSTWREGGLALHGTTDASFNWNVGLTTGQDFTGWDFAPEYPQYQSALELINNGPAPLQATHQELQLAKAKRLAQYAALSYTGVKGLTVGGTAFTNAVGNGMHATLLEGHARWQPGNFDISALYAQGLISGTEKINALNAVGSPNPIPSAFNGYYMQVAYKAWESGSYKLAPFVRGEHYDMGQRYQGVPGAAIPSGPVPLEDGSVGFYPQQHDNVWTVGANFYLTPHVVFKADYQKFQTNNEFTRFDLGMGLAF